MNVSAIRPRDKAVGATGPGDGHYCAQEPQPVNARTSIIKYLHGQRKGNFKNSLWRHSNRKRKQLISHERSPLRRRECRGRSAVCRFVRSEFGLNSAHVSPGPTGRFRLGQPTRVVGKLGFCVDTAQRLVQISLMEISLEVSPRECHIRV
jgi:hypothetical protein